MTERAAYSLPERFYEEANRWLDRRAAGEPDFAAKLDAWLSADLRNRQAFAESEAMLTESQILPKGAAGFDGRLMKAPLLQRRTTHVALAAAAAISVAGFATVLLGGQRLFPDLASPARAATYETGIGEIRTFRLGDASAITLDTDTRISVSVSGEQRHIDISRGRIRIDNTPSLGTFLVTAGARSATVRGARFDATMDGSALLIGASDKAVELAAAEPASLTPRTIAEGTEIVIGSSASSVPLPRADMEWVKGMLTLDGTRLAEAVGAINRYNRIKIRLGSAGLGEREITGAFRANDPDAFADVVARMFDLRVDRSKGSEIVLVLGPN